jgi:hypothetical protein
MPLEIFAANYPPRRRLALKFRQLIIAALTVAIPSTVAAAREISDAFTAIKVGRDACSLKPSSASGKWQAVLIKDQAVGDEWHVWFGKNSVEPVCGFVGAVVKSDGSYTSCRESACQMLPRKRN